MLRKVAAILTASSIDVVSPSSARAVGFEDDHDGGSSIVNGLSSVFVRRLSHDDRSDSRDARAYDRRLAYRSRALCEGDDAPKTKSTTSIATDDESIRFESALNRHRSRLSTYRKEWEYSSTSGNGTATTSTKTPTRSWPHDVPDDDELSSLLADMKYCDRRDAKYGLDDPADGGGGGYCAKLRFRVASGLLAQVDDEERQRIGLRMLRLLAESDHPDAMAYYGMCLNDGRAGMDPHPEGAMYWFERCAGTPHDHPHGRYELGVSYYTGEGVIEDEVEAVRLFALAAKQHHPGACYMLGDCLLDGVGVEMDRAEALEWLICAARLGHRGARSRVMAVLERREGEDYGEFTDASRQTLIERDDPPTVVANRTGVGTIVPRRGTTIADRSEMARRRTIAGYSRG